MTVMDDDLRILAETPPPVPELTKDVINSALFPPDSEHQGKTLFVGLKPTGWAFFREVSPGNYSHVRRCHREENDRFTAIFHAVRLRCRDYENGGAPIPIVIGWEPR